MAGTRIHVNLCMEWETFFLLSVKQIFKVTIREWYKLEKEMKKKKQRKNLLETTKNFQAKRKTEFMHKKTLNEISTSRNTRETERMDDERKEKQQQAAAAATMITTYTIYIYMRYIYNAMCSKTMTRLVVRATS